MATGARARFARAGFRCASRTVARKRGGHLAKPFRDLLHRPQALCARGIATVAAVGCGLCALIRRWPPHRHARSIHSRTSDPPTPRTTDVSTHPTPTNSDKPSDVTQPRAHTYAPRNTTQPHSDPGNMPKSPQGRATPPPHLHSHPTNTTRPTLPQSAPAPAGHGRMKRPASAISVPIRTHLPAHVMA